MKHITDDMIDAVISPKDAQAVLHEAFRMFGMGKAAMQERVRTEAGGVKLSTMGAVIPGQQVAGAKVYSTINGNFNFVILLFSTEDGRALASFEANAITRLRTAACSLIAASYLARPGAKKMTLFGAGVQGKSHAVQFSQVYALDEIRICDPYAPPEIAKELEKSCETKVVICDAQSAIESADIIVTASRSKTPLFEGADISPGCFVGAIGSSLPHTRELDDTALRRSSRIAVEWLHQTSQEAGDLVLAQPGLVTPGKLVELGELVTGKSKGRGGDDEITIYKSVGVGLEDIALAGLAWERLNCEK